MASDEERDELAGIIEDNRHGGSQFQTHFGPVNIGLSSDMIAAAILAAGWRPPARVIETFVELENCAPGTVVRDSRGEIAERSKGWRFFGLKGEFSVLSVWLPATVIWEPKEEQ